MKKNQYIYLFLIIIFVIAIILIYPKTEKLYAPEKPLKTPSFETVDFDDLERDLYLKVGEEFNLNINIVEEGIKYHFSDNTDLFNISDTGFISFIPKTNHIGTNPVVIIVIDNQGNAQTKVVLFHVKEAS